MNRVPRVLGPWMFAALASAAAPTTEPVDYSLLSHTLAIESLRAGNHDASGVNDYYFTVSMYGLLNSAEERNLPLPKRKQVPVDLGSFGETKIAALSAWRADDKTKDVKELRVLGNAVRELTAQTMTRFHASESEVAVMVEVTMLERAKTLGFFGEDLRIASASYYPIPQSKFDGPARGNLTLALTDDKGTSVKLAARYDDAAIPTTADRPAAVGAGAAVSAGAVAAGTAPQPAK